MHRFLARIFTRTTHNRRQAQQSCAIAMDADVDGSTVPLPASSHIDKKKSKFEQAGGKRLETLKPNERFRKIYDEGAPLFTKEGIRDLEDQLAKVPQPTKFQLRKFDGSAMECDRSLEMQFSRG